MSTERDLLFALARQEFTPAHKQRAEDICRERTVDWDTFTRCAAHEGVAPVVGVNLAACDADATGVPAAVTGQLQGTLFENALFKAQNRVDLGEILPEVVGRGYHVLLQKSIALEVAGVYQHAWVTSARDIDLVLRWTRGTGTPPDMREVRRMLDIRGIECGLECSLVAHHDLSLNGIVDVSFDEVWRDAREMPAEWLPASGIYAMCPEDLLLTLCLNGARKRYFRLKTLFDIAETVSHYPDLDWDRLARRARGWRAEGMAFSALCAADETLGLPDASCHAFATLVSPGRRVALASMVKLLRRSEPDRRLPLMALQYAGFTNRQRWRSARETARGGLPAPSLATREAALLPGE
jgi:hypothetical protein